MFCWSADQDAEKSEQIKALFSVLKILVLLEG